MIKLSIVFHRYISIAAHYTHAHAQYIFFVVILVYLRMVEEFYIFFFLGPVCSKDLKKEPGDHKPTGYS
jgi:hypothetical protein